MSYSFNNPCWNCKKHPDCTDAKKVQDAVTDIHSDPKGLNDEAGHCGSGEIILMCTRLDRKN